MGEVINLRQARKRFARRTKAADAEENRNRFGEKTAARRQREVEERVTIDRLDAHRLGQAPMSPWASETDPGAAGTGKTDDISSDDGSPT